jgi:CCR4-NOT transcription complex subunit 7/8
MVRTSSGAPLFGQIHDSAATVHGTRTSSGALFGQTENSPADTVHGTRAMKIMDVWSHNASTAYGQISEIMKDGDRLMVAIDSEFAVPDNCAVNDGEPQNPEAFYSQTRNMVNGGSLVQFGLVLATHRQVLGIWQFNLHFSPSWRAPYHPGILFLREKAGINFDHHESRGIPAVDFTRWMSGSGLLRNSNVTWITFAGYNDFGFLTYYVTGAELGPDRQGFLKTLRDLFPQSYDIRIFTKLGRCRTAVINGGLSKVCEKLEVKNPWSSSQFWL